MKLKKVFGIIVVILLLIVVSWLGIFLYRDSRPQPVIELKQLKQPTATINVTVKINFADKHLDYPISVIEPATVLTALQAIKDLPIKIQDYGKLGQLVTTIGDQVNGQDGKYWQYWLNGVYAQIGADQQSVRANDLIEWKFTNEQKQ